MIRKSLLFGALFTVVMAACAGSAGAWQMKQAVLMTDWAAQVDPNNPWPEYPRPQMARTDWLNLNGIWQYKRGYSGDAVPVGQNLGGEILVPYPIESAISGVMEHFDRIWYRRTFTVPAAWSGRRIMLNFGAVDWEAEIYINGHSMGSHQGGYDPFSYDITPYLNPSGAQEMIVRVYDPTDSGGQPRGKQVNSPGGIFYTPATGIWQTVWLEPLPATSISSLKIVPDVDGSRLKLTVNVSGPADGITVSATALDGDNQVGSVTGAPGTQLDINIPSPKLWSPNSPFLYNLDISLSSGTTVLDNVKSYFGMRKIQRAVSGGINKILLNNQFTFLMGPLDQGFWPDGIYTPPTDEAMAWDLQTEKQLGFNAVRKHVKVEPLRWYYWADKLGLLVFQDMPSANNSTSADKSQYERELNSMIQSHWNSPSIGVWVVFNEGWGQYDTERLTNLTMDLDPSRLVECASGWTDYEAGHIIDSHSYPHPFCPISSTRARVNGEYGGIGYAVPGHMWDPNSWGYTMVFSPEELTDLYGQFTSTEVGNYKDSSGLSAAIYTQITDCETEINGLITYDRKVIKPIFQGINDANHFSYTPIISYQDVVGIGQMWKYTTTAPSSDWYSTAFSDSTWNQGAAGFGSIGFYQTSWSSPDIWIRRTFNPGSLTADQRANLFLKMFHDENAEVYINGMLACQVSGYNSDYQYFRLTQAGLDAIVNNTDNLMAIHCHQTGGGQYIDAGLTLRTARGSTHTLTPSAAAGGTISPCTPILVLSGDNETFTITPKANYEVSNVLIDGNSVGAVSSYTFSNVNANHTISAEFAYSGPACVITASAGEGGSISPSGDVVVTYRGEHIFNISADAGYMIADVIVDGVSRGAVSSYTFADVTANHTILAVFTAYPDPVPVAWYQFENNMLDTLGAYDGTAYGNPAFASGKIGPYAIQLNGTNQYIAASRPVSDSFTIAFWVKTTQTGSSGAQWHQGSGLVDGEVAGIANDFGISYLNSRAAFGVGNSDTTIQSMSTINSGDWVHVACSRDGASGQMRIYINGILETTGTGPAGIKDASSVLHIGNLQTNLNYFSGAIDQLKIYDRVLSFAEISALAGETTTHTITAITGDNGSVTPSGTVSVNSGAAQTFIISPSAGFGIADMKVDGVSIVPAASYTFGNVAANHTISVAFAEVVGMNNRSALTDNNAPGRVIKIWGRVKSINPGTSFAIDDGYGTPVIVNINGAALPSDFGADQFVVVTGLLSEERMIYAQEVQSL